MRVLHIINGEHYAGAERVQDLLAIKLNDLGYEIGFACIKPGEFPQRRMAKLARLHCVPMSSRLDLWAAFRLARIVKENQYRLIHTHTARSALVGRIVSFVSGVPMVHHVHSPTARDTESWIRNILNTASQKFSLLGTKYLIAVSDSLAKYMQECGLGEKPIKVIPNGVPSRPQLTSKERPQTDWAIGCIALFRPRKGLEILLEALAQLHAEDFRVTLLAVGGFETPEYEDFIKRRSVQLGVESKIVWAGFREDVNAELAKMDLFVLPSLFGEGMPMVILEAMAMGVPVLASAVEGVPEVLEHNLSGLLVPPGDPDALADAIANLIQGKSDWGALREAAYRAQVERYSDETMAAAVAQIYGEVLADGVASSAPTG